jgi:hypothetical protein
MKFPHFAMVTQGNQDVDVAVLVAEVLPELAGDEDRWGSGPSAFLKPLFRRLVNRFVY